MKLVTRVKLLPEADQAAALRATLRAVNDAANWLSGQAQPLPQRDRSRKALQSLAYAKLKARGLSAQPALHVIRKVADAYKTRAANLKVGSYGKKDSDRYRKIAAKTITFRPDAAQAYDDRCLSWQVDDRTVSIWTTAGRVKGVRFACSSDAAKLLADHRQGESDLIQRNGEFYLIATCEVPEVPLNTTPDGWIGVDLGIANIATTSDTDTPYAGDKLNRYRRNMIRVRAELQARRTRSAKRLLKKRHRREQRHAANQNHIIAKTIVTEAERTGRGIALEDLTGIRGRVRLRKPQRVALHSWAFAQLGTFLQYKAQRAGVPLVYVDPAYTSQRCSWCGHTEKANRLDQATFACRSCGVVAHADWNAARNIAALAPSVGLPSTSLMQRNPRQRIGFQRQTRPFRAR